MKDIMLDLEPLATIKEYKKDSADLAVIKSVFGGKS